MADTPKNKPNYQPQPNSFEKGIIFLNRFTANTFWKIMDNLAYHNRKIDEIYERIIGSEYARECKEFHLSNHKKLIHIGCGAYPLTEIILAEASHLEILGIDKDPTTVKLATNLIRKKNFQHRVTIAYGDGLNYPLNEFDVIIISSCSVPKIDVLKNIFSRAPKGTVIIIRELGSALDTIIDYINHQPEIELVNKIHHFKISWFGPIIWNSLYVRKK
jgi:protein-L-isoaspartate O-methyltransferase